MPPKRPSDALVGAVLADTYRIVAPLRKGGMGLIYRAANVRLPKLRYAIKVLRPDWIDDEANFAANYARFRREAEIVSSLQHPNILNVLDFNKTSEGYPYLVMELLEGEDLEVRLKRQRKLTLPDTCQLVEQIGAALQAAHHRGVVHRDLKPSNIFLCPDEKGETQAKLLDFGISKYYDADRSSAVTVQKQMIIGTASYMSPEQAKGLLEEIDHRSDIFSLATIVYRCLSGEKPFTGPSDSDVRFNVCFARAPALEELVDDLPPGVQQALARAHEKKKHKRYDDVGGFVRAFVEAVNHPTDKVPIVPRAARRSVDVTGPQRPVSEDESEGEQRAKGPILAVSTDDVATYVLPSGETGQERSGTPVRATGQLPRLADGETGSRTLVVVAAVAAVLALLTAGLWVVWPDPSPAGTVDARARRDAAPAADRGVARDAAATDLLAADRAAPRPKVRRPRPKVRRPRPKVRRPRPKKPRKPLIVDTP